MSQFDDMFSAKAEEWEPAEGEWAAGTLIEVNEGISKYRENVLIILDAKAVKNSNFVGNLSCWANKVMQAEIAKHGKIEFDLSDRDSRVDAVKSMIGRGIIIRFEGWKEGKDYKYKNYQAKLLPQYDRKSGDIFGGIHE